MREHGGGRIDLRLIREANELQRARARESEAGRVIMKRVKARVIENQFKEARAGRFTIFCDEESSRHGTDRAPTPLDYLGAAVAF